MLKIASIVYVTSMIMVLTLNCSGVDFASQTTQPLSTLKNPDGSACSDSPNDYSYDPCQTSGRLGYTKTRVSKLPACYTTTAVKEDEPGTCHTYDHIRCSQEYTLSEVQAAAQRAWMKKCEPSITQIKTFFKITTVATDSTLSAAQTSIRAPNYNPIMRSKSDETWQPPTTLEAACDVPGGMEEIDEICTPGCHTPDQRLQVDVDGGTLPIGEAKDAELTTIAIVSANSSLDRIEIASAQVDRFITTTIDETHDIAVLELSSGQKLRLTPNHPLVGTDGEIHLANDVVEGDSLLRSDGGAERVIAATKGRFHGRVYNVSPRSNDPSSNGELIIAEGVVQGSHKHQMNAAQLVRRKLLRHNLSKDLF